MKSNVNTLLEYQLQFKSGVAYLIPTKWWTQFCQLNQKTQSKQQLNFPSLNLEKYVDTFLLEFQDSIVAELEHKSNYLKFNKIFLSPQIKTNFQWTLISSEVWQLIQNKLKCRLSLLTLYNESNPQCAFTKNLMQLQIIFCSRIKSDAFVGFLPQTTDMIQAVRAIGYELGYVEMNNSKIVFPDKNPDKSYFYCELEKKSLLQSSDTLLLAFNLECLQQKDSQNQILNYSFGKGDEMANSNEAMAGDIGVLGIESFQQPRNDGTMSTGAETPSFFGSEDQNMREFRVRELFRQKQPQQIEELRVKAKKIVKGKLISAKQHSQQQIKQSLELVVLELMEHINLHKKRTHKQKQSYHQ